MHTTTPHSGRSAAITRDKGRGAVSSWIEEWTPFPRKRIPDVVSLWEAQAARFREEAIQLLEELEG